MTAGARELNAYINKLTIEEKKLLALELKSNCSWPNHKDFLLSNPAKLFRSRKLLKKYAL